MSSVAMSLYGIIPADAKWKKMVAALKARKEAGVDPPEEVEEFFEEQDPEGDGAAIDLEDQVQEWAGEMREGLEIEVSDIPKNVKTLRFVISF